MKPVLVVAALSVVVIVAGLVTDASAQSHRGRDMYGPIVDPPRTELGVGVGLWTLISGPLANVRLSRNWTPWATSEITLERGAIDNGDSRYGMVIVAGRLTTPPGDDVTLFATAGGAAGIGLNYATSPMFGVGLQAGWRKW